MMLGLTDPTYGTVKVCGINSTTNPIEVKRKVGYLPEDVGFYDEYTGLENLLYTARLNGIPDGKARQEAVLLLEKVGLSNEAEKKAGKYSRGMRQRLGLADVLIKNPEVIILDEPTLGIDPKGVQEFLDMIVRLRSEEGRTVLLCSHHLHQVQQICDRIGIFVGGKLIAEGDLHSLSEKLFSEEPYTIVAGIRIQETEGSGSASDNSISERLKDSVRSIDGVLNVDLEDNILHIGCKYDTTEEIIKVIVESGIGITNLDKKEHGLNEIYNRHFDGVDSHE
jgi:ABC-2 type transport system ATP-binding protein